MRLQSGDALTLDINHLITPDVYFLMGLVRLFSTGRCRSFSMSRVAIVGIWLGFIADAIRQGASIPASRWAYHTLINRYGLVILILPFVVSYFAMTLPRRFQHRFDRFNNRMEKKYWYGVMDRFSKRLDADSLFVLELMSTGVSGVITTAYTSEATACYIICGAFFSAGSGMFAFLLLNQPERNFVTRLLTRTQATSIVTNQ